MYRLHPSVFAALAIVGLLVPAAGASTVRITEFMSEGSGGSGQRAREFVELSNLGDLAVDATSWTFNDDNPNNPVIIGPSFGVITPGESVIITEVTPDAFRSIWGLPVGVRIASIGGSSNLGDSDTINIYDSGVQTPDRLVDTLVYTSATKVRGVSRNRPLLGGTDQYPNDVWVTSAIGDAYGSHYAPSPPSAEQVDLGNPGSYPRIPEPATVLSLALGAITALGVRRRK